MSSAKHFTEVLIGGKVYTLSGFEGEEYLQKVSSYLNHKITECTNSEGYRKQSADTRKLAKLKEENNDLQMQIVKLETEMKNRRR